MWSFDVFDTCLVRRNALPTDVFLTVATRLENTLKPALGPDYAEIFREIRTSAEEIALKTASTEETTLETIWHYVNQLIPELDVYDGLSTELTVETANLFPVAATLARVTEGRRRFGRVVFISDTYFPENFIRTQLKAGGFLCDDDLCFVSSSSLKTKRTGRLYDEVLSKLNIKPKDLTHHGDNYQSDIEAARSRGITAVHITDAVLNFREREVGRKLQSLNAEKTSVLIGAMRIGRLSAETEDQHAARSLVAQFVGPLLWVLADWLLTRAHRDEIKRLYFCSRDCHGLYEVATILAIRRGINIECRYLFVSRQALLLPSVLDISPEGMPWLRRSWESGKLRSLAGKLDIDVALIIAAMASDFPGINGESRLISDNHWNAFWQALNSPSVKSAILEKITDRREAAIKYFRQEGMFDEIKIALVDLGWHQSGQYALTTLLRTKDPKFSISAYFLGLVDRRSAYIRKMPAQALFHRAPYDRRTALSDDVFYSRIGLLEHILNCAPHGSVHHYETSPETYSTVPKFLNTSKEEVFAKQSLLKNLQIFAANHIQPLSFTDYESRTTFNAILSTAALNPDKEWAQIASAIGVADDQNNLDQAPMIKPRSLKNAAHDAFALRDLKRLNPYKLGTWPELSLKCTSGLALSTYRATGAICDAIRASRRTITGKNS